MSQTFFTFLSGKEEVPPVRTAAFGNAAFFLSKDRKKLFYRLQVNRIRRLTQAHIHIGRRGENGPVVAFLFGPVQPGISVDQGVVTGTITSDDLVGPLRGEPLESLIQLMKEERTYVNVHTEQHPAGEIRGQIQPLFRKR
ncbi:CHRD domain-containing protein [Desmospora profundinema]|uniref:CHRD domain-containing protein n=1 Tax=Desmospora profundinema TaxID=1571184 RepID=A0ABU1IHE1_9BACL|nr:CHRD domain-containing protein [Desmospora profundinema]MDR6224192.1 hypothetical protein [Desmospora profundinema]